MSEEILEEEEKAGSPILKILLIVFGVLLIVAITIGATLFASGFFDADKDEDAEAAVAALEAAAEAEAAAAAEAEFQAAAAEDEQEEEDVDDGLTFETSTGKYRCEHRHFLTACLPAGTRINYSGSH